MYSRDLLPALLLGLLAIVAYAVWRAIQRRPGTDSLSFSHDTPPSSFSRDGGHVGDGGDVGVGGAGDSWSSGDSGGGDSSGGDTGGSSD